MIKNQRINRDNNSNTIPHSDSEISDGMPPVLADPSRAGIGFYQKAIFSDRGDKNRYIILHAMPIRKRVREAADALGRFMAWGIIFFSHIKDAHNKLPILPVKDNKPRQVKTGRLTSHNLALPAGGIRRPHPRLDSGGRGCGSAWSLCDMTPPENLKQKKLEIVIPSVYTA